jgi:hypothetical protein
MKKRRGERQEEFENLSKCNAKKITVSKVYSWEIFL